MLKPYLKPFYLKIFYLLRIDFQAFDIKYAFYPTKRIGKVVKISVGSIRI